MGLKPGDDVVIVYKDGDIKITTLERAVRRAQEMVKRHNPEGRSLVDELIADRREEATRE